MQSVTARAQDHIDHPVLVRHDVANANRFALAVRIEISPDASGATAITASAADRCGGLIRLSSLGPRYQQRFTELFNALQGTT